MNTAPLKDSTPKDIPTQFAFPAPSARQVSLVGDFNDWNSQSMPMRRGHDGVWRRNVPLKPGHHEYRFIADGVWQDDPAAEQRTANAMGSENCVKTVAG
jgi:1,4-alpha-glucan branching enzyme